MKRAVSRRRGARLVAGAALSAIALIQGLRAPVVDSHDVHIAGLPAALDGTVVLGLSDLHLGSLLGTSWLAARVRQAQAERPDVFVFIGDVVEAHEAPGSDLLAELRRLSAPLGVWSVPGSLEFHAVSKDIATFFEAAGIHLLRNAWVELRPGLAPAGVDDAAASESNGVALAHLEAALARRPPGAVLLPYWLATRC